MLPSARFLLPLLASACLERGGFTIVGGEDDVQVDDTDPRTDETDVKKPDVDDTGLVDTEDVVAGEPYPCGLDLYPPDDRLGAPSRVFLGSARVRRTQGLGAWSWTGCEVERHFDAEGGWLCDIVRQAKGEGNDALFQSPEVQLDVELTVDPTVTTCDVGVGLRLRYGVDIGLPLERKVTLHRTQTGPWSVVGTFAAKGTASDVRFDYGTAFTR